MSASVPFHGSAQHATDLAARSGRMSLPRQPHHHDHHHRRNHHYHRHHHAPQLFLSPLLLLCELLDRISFSSSSALKDLSLSLSYSSSSSRQLACPDFFSRLSSSSSCTLPRFFLFRDRGSPFNSPDLSQVYRGEQRVLYFSFSTYKSRNKRAIRLLIARRKERSATRAVRNVRACESQEVNSAIALEFLARFLLILFPSFRVFSAAFHRMHFPSVG